MEPTAINDTVYSVQPSMTSPLPTSITGNSPLAAKDSIAAQHNASSTGVSSEQVNQPDTDDEALVPGAGEPSPEPQSPAEVQVSTEPPSAAVELTPSVNPVVPPSPPLVNEPTQDAPASFETVAEAIEALPKYESVTMDSGEDDEQIQPRRPPKRSRNDESSLPALRAPKERRRASMSRDDDTEPEQQTKVKRRRTLPAPREVEGIVDMSLSAVPEGWKQPLLYFVEGRPYDYSRNKWVHELEGESQTSERSKAKSGDRTKWLRLGDTLLSTGAIYLSSKESGTPNVPGHVEGPTAVIRDLCAVVQAGANDPVPLHLGAYTALSRANSRENINPKGLKWNSGMAITRLMKVGNEKEAVQPLPLDLIARCLLNNIRDMMSNTDLFPAHLFASPMHLLQFGPTVGIHLLAANKARQLAELVRIFVDDDTTGLLDELEEGYTRKTGGSRISGGRRRSANKAKEFAGLRSYPMTPSERDQLKVIFSKLEIELDQLRHGLEIPWASVSPPENENWEKSVLPIQVNVLCLSAAALRFKVYQYYGVKPRMLELWDEGVEEKPLQDVLKHLGKEDSLWLMNPQPRAFLDFTLTEGQEQWLLKRSRGEIKQTETAPSGDNNAAYIWNLIEAASNDITEENQTANCELTLVLSNAPTKTGEFSKATIGLKATTGPIGWKELRLCGAHHVIEWEDLVAEETESDSSAS